MDWRRGDSMIQNKGNNTFGSQKLSYSDYKNLGLLTCYLDVDGRFYIFLDRIPCLDI